MPKEIVDKYYKVYWEFIKKKIEELPLKEPLTEQEFSKLRKSFNIKGIGKLYCTYDTWKGTNKGLKIKYEKINNKESKTTIQQNSNNC